MAAASSSKTMALWASAALRLDRKAFNARFTNTALLYWDKILTIAPFGTNYVLEPENQNDLLIQNGAIKQVRPERYSNSYAKTSAPTLYSSLIVCILSNSILPLAGGPRCRKPGFVADQYKGNTTRYSA
jgi:hypothetical protein